MTFWTKPGQKATLLVFTVYVLMTSAERANTPTVVKRNENRRYKTMVFNCATFVKVI